ncbi:hypothetical protein GCM10009754_29770 [Amycolatopsis minnesotensis]|uniref:Uncharacterized protein n=1 Tax=Amycolatopsis minnesotensis TaxID=337894 RepID=A0ABP5C7J2_9PSEU
MCGGSAASGSSRRTGPFTIGSGALVSGATLALTTAMTGRVARCDDPDGAGVAILRDRSAGHSFMMMLSST